MLHSKRWLLAGCAVGLMTAPAVASAQQRATEVEELLVTAEKREQSIQDVPVAITAITAEQKEVIGITSIQDIANFTPGLVYSTFFDRPNIRGIGRLTNNFGIDNGVASYNDGFYSSSAQGAGARALFIERVEVLRGPQGTLYGRNSIGGAINTISKRPAREFGGEVHLVTQTYETTIVEGTVSVPVADWLRLRVNGYRSKQEEGYFKNVTGGPDEGFSFRQGFAVLAAGEVGERFSYFAKVEVADYDERPRSTASTAPFVASVQNAPSPGTSFSGTSVPFGYFTPTAVFSAPSVRQNPVLLADSLRVFQTDTPSRQTLDDHYNLVGEATWSADGFDVKYVGGRQHYLFNLDGDNDNTSVASFVWPGTTTRVPSQFVSLYTEDRTWWSHELSIASTTDAPFQWIAGAYYYEEEYDQPTQVFNRGLAALNAPVRSSAAGATPAANPVPFRSFFSNASGDQGTRAVYGQADYKLTDAWKFTAGVRYTEDDKDITESSRTLSAAVCTIPTGCAAQGVAFGAIYATDITTLFAPGGGIGSAPGVVSNPVTDPATGIRTRQLSGKWHGTTGTAGVEWTPNTDTLVYFRFSRGYKAGGFNAGLSAALPGVTPEHVNAYELGTKLDLLDRTLRLNTAIFYYDYTDIQLQLPVLERCTDPNDPATCTLVNRQQNLESAETKGFEVEAFWNPVENLQLQFTYGYLDAQIKEGRGPAGFGFQNSLDPAALLPTADPLTQLATTDTFTRLRNFTQDLSGNPIPGQPKHKASFNANYRFDLKDYGDLRLSASYVWRGKTYDDLFGSKLNLTPSWDTVDLRALWTSRDGDYTVIGYVRNLFNVNAYEGSQLSRQNTGRATVAAPTAAGQAYYLSYTLGPPRVAGLELQYRF